MKSILRYLCAAFLIGFAAPAFADTTACSAPISVQPYQPDVQKLKRQAGYINLWWNSAEAKPLPAEARKAQREQDIGDFFSQIEQGRRQVYSNAQCLVVATKRCASTPGRRHSCPMMFSPPVNMTFLKNTLQPIDDDFDVAPHFVGENVEFTNKKTGAGSNTDGFQAIAAYTPEYVNSAVSSDLSIVHNAVDALFSDVPLISTTN